MPRLPKLLRTAPALPLLAVVLALAFTLLAGPSATLATAGTVSAAERPHTAARPHAAEGANARGKAKTAAKRKAVKKSRRRVVKPATKRAPQSAQAPTPPSSQTSQTSLQPGAGRTLPAEGIFASCQLSAGLAPCEQNLQALQAAGFTVAVQTVNADLPTMSAYAAYAQSIGVSIMWQLNDPGFWGGAWAGSSAPNDFPQFASACGCTAPAQILSTMIPWLAALPATYGYYAADDELLTSSESAGLTQYVSQIRAADPTHMIMVGSNASQGLQYYSTGATIGNEIYPQTTGSLMPVSQNEDIWSSVAQSASQDQHAADAAGTQSAFILQAFSFGDNLTDGEAVGVCTPTTSLAQCSAELPYPAAAAQLQLRNEVLLNAHPKLLLWYNFGESYADSARWAGLQQAISAPYPTSAA